MLPRYDEHVRVTPEARAEALEVILKEGQTYSIAFMCDGTAVQKDDQTKSEVIKQSRLYQHFQVFQPGGLNLAGFEAVHKHGDPFDL